MNSLARRLSRFARRSRMGPGDKLAIRVLLAAAIIPVLATNAAAQGCAMCYQNAASSGTQGRAALRHGIVILLIPALSLFAGVFALIYSRRPASPASSSKPSSGAD